LPKNSIYTLVTGVRYALPSSPEALMFGKSLIPSGMHWSAFGIGRMAFPVVAQAWLLGGHVRIGLEDTIYLDKGVLAPSNAALVARAKEIIQHLGGTLANLQTSARAVGLAFTQRIKNMKALQLAQPSASPEAIQVNVITQQAPTCGPTEAVVRVLMAAINPSDVKASLGHMPQAVFPRTPGRDYVGIVELGPKEWVGKTVFGSGGDVGITRDGSHATWLVLPQRALLEKPAALTLTQAACMGVPYVTALDGFAKAGYPQPGETILIGGAMGKVGLAAAAIAKVYGARVIGIKRKSTAAVPGHACDVLFDLEDPELSTKLMAETQQRGFPLFFNTVGKSLLGLVTRCVGAQRSTNFDLHIGTRLPV